MADIDEKIPETAADVPVDVKDTVPSNPIDEEPIGALGRPEGWMYREIKIGPIRIPWYASPKTQLTMVAFVCFMCPGMFNALGGLGGGGKADAKTADDMVSAPIFSEIHKIAFASLNIASLEHRPVQYFCCLWFLRWQHRQQIGRQIHSIIRWNRLLHLCHRSPVHSTHTGGFSIFAGAFLGVCAGLLWTAQGTIMLSYPNEGSKGRYFAWFWAIFNLGGVIGALVSFNSFFFHCFLSPC